MAQIGTHERKRATWMWWTAAVVVLALPLWWMMSAGGGTRTVRGGDIADSGSSASTGNMSSPIPGLSSPDARTVTTVASLATPAVVSDLVGRPVMIRDAVVTRTPTENVYWIAGGSADAPDVFVVCIRGTPPDMIRIAKQSHVRIDGTVAAIPSNLGEFVLNWELNPADSAALASRQFYVRADSVTSVPDAWMEPPR